MLPLTAAHDPEECADCNSGQMHIFSDGTDSYVTTCVYEIPVLFERMYGDKYPVDDYHDCGESLPDVWIKQPDDAPFTILEVDTEGYPATVKPCGVWARESGPGFLCSTEW